MLLGWVWATWGYPDPQSKSGSQKISQKNNSPEGCHFLSKSKINTAPKIVVLGDPPWRAFSLIMDPP